MRKDYYCPAGKLSGHPLLERTMEEKRSRQHDVCLLRTHVHVLHQATSFGIFSTYGRNHVEYTEENRTCSVIGSLTFLHASHAQSVHMLMFTTITIMMMSFVSVVGSPAHSSKSRRLFSFFPLNALKNKSCAKSITAIFPSPRRPCTCARRAPQVAVLDP